MMLITIKLKYKQRSWRGGVLELGFISELVVTKR
jgi:hypothetical protein